MLRAKSEAFVERVGKTRFHIYRNIYLVVSVRFSINSSAARLQSKAFPWWGMGRVGWIKGPRFKWQRSWHMPIWFLFGWLLLLPRYLIYYCWTDWHAVPSSVCLFSSLRVMDGHSNSATKRERERVSGGNNKYFARHANTNKFLSKHWNSIKYVLATPPQSCSSWDVNYRADGCQAAVRRLK